MVPQVQVNGIILMRFWDLMDLLVSPVLVVEEMEREPMRSQEQQPEFWVVEEVDLLSHHHGPIRRSRVPVVLTLALLVVELLAQVAELVW
jgi:hypothetical protein